METIVVSTGWLVFISIFNYFVPTWNKDSNNNNKIDCSIFQVEVIVVSAKVVVEETDFFC